MRLGCFVLLQLQTGVAISQFHRPTCFFQVRLGLGCHQPLLLEKVSGVDIRNLEGRNHPGASCYQPSVGNLETPDINKSSPQQPSLVLQVVLQKQLSEF